MNNEHKALAYILTGDDTLLNEVFPIKSEPVFMSNRNSKKHVLQSRKKRNKHRFNIEQLDSDEILARQVRFKSHKHRIITFEEAGNYKGARVLRPSTKLPHKSIRFNHESYLMGRYSKKKKNDDDKS